MQPLHISPATRLHDIRAVDSGRKAALNSRFSVTQAVIICMYEYNTINTPIDFNSMTDCSL